MKLPMRRKIQTNILQSIRVPSLPVPFCRLPLVDSLILLQGTGDATFTRDSQASVNDNGVIKFVAANKLTESDTTVAQLDVNGGAISDATSFPGFENGIQFPTSPVATAFAYKSFTTLNGVDYVFSVFVIMNDGSTPAPSTSSSSGDFSLVSDGNGFTGTLGSIKLIDSSTNLYRVDYLQTSTAASANNGVAQFTGQSGKGFKVTGYQLVEGNKPCEYQKTEATAGADVPRFEANGFLGEGESENLGRSSEDYTGAGWGTNTTITIDAVVAPDGSMTADKLDDTSAVSSQDASQAITVGGGIVTASNYIRADSNVVARLRVRDGNSAVTSLAVNAVLGWERFSVSSTNSGATGGSGAIFVHPRDVVSETGFTYDWGAQLENLSFASSYIPVTTAPRTRAADGLSVVAANIPAPTADYTVSIKVDALGFDSTKSQVIYNVNGETTRRIEWDTATGKIKATHGAVVSLSTSVFAAGEQVKVAFVVDGTNQTLYINGVQEAQAAKGSVTGTATSISILNNGGADEAFSHGQDFRIYDKALTPTQVTLL